MSAYVIVGYNPKEKNSLQQYADSVPETLTNYFGKVIAKGDAEQLHGTFDYQIQVILSFPSKEHAANWYHSPEYQQLIEIRNTGMDSQFQLIG